MKLGREFSVKGTSHGMRHCSPYDDNPGDNTEHESHGYKLSTSAGGGWHGSVSTQIVGLTPVQTRGRPLIVGV
ncbi:MAG: hypothetical protein ACRDNS_01590 [Trebonia sp.]